MREFECINRWWVWRERGIVGIELRDNYDIATWLCLWMMFETRTVWKRKQGQMLEKKKPLILSDIYYQMPLLTGRAEGGQRGFCNRWNTFDQSKFLFFFLISSCSHFMYLCLLLIILLERMWLTHAFVPFLVFMLVLVIRFNNSNLE